MKKLYTHSSVDLDAVASIWGAKQFIPDTKNATIEFRPANWDGADAEGGSLILDIDANGKGIKGEKETSGLTHSCFAFIVNQYASETEKKAISNLVKFVDAQDTSGLAVKVIAPEINKEAVEVLSSTGINAVLRSLQSIFYQNDSIVVDRMSEIFSGMLKSGIARQRAVIEAEKANILPGGKVAIVTNSREFATNGILFDQKGIKVIVYIDGFNLGIIREGSVEFRMDHINFRTIVKNAGEESEWFAHPAGFLFCRGSRKAKAETMSKVDPMVLAEVANNFFQ